MAAVPLVMTFEAIPSQIRRLFLPKRFAILEACLIGFVSGLAAIGLKFGVALLGGWRIKLAAIGAPEFILPIVGLVGGLIAGSIIQWIAPETYGSGVPQVKAVLAKVPVVLNLRTALAKLLGAIISIGSGIVLGREGPTIQVGAALAAQLSQWFPTSPEYRRQLIAAGASAGLAAAFNAPITGVLFVVEALLQDTSSFSLGTGILAAFIGAVISRQLGGGEFSMEGAIGYASNIQFHALEIPIFILLGILTGAIGALFNQGLLFSARLFRKGGRLPIPVRLGIAGLICGAIIASLPPSFRDSAGLKSLITAGGTNNYLTGLAFLVHASLTLVAYGSGAPGGLSSPSIILGTALGLLVGNWADYFGLIHDVQTYALVGGGGFFCAVARTPVTAVIIIFELVGNFEIVLPLMIVSVVSYFVAERIHSGSIYEHILAANGIDLHHRSESSSSLTDLKAIDVMQRQVESLDSTMPLKETIGAFARSHHRGFPVLLDGNLVGIITQTDLATAAEKNLDGDTPISEVMTPGPVTIHPQAKLAEVLYLLNRYQLSRLPVTEGRHLLGIITRTDIIRAESDQLSATIEVHHQPSYGVYQTRSPSTGRGKILVLLNNPKTVLSLMHLARTIAQTHEYEIECLHIITVNRGRSPMETPVETAKGRRLLRQAQQLAKHWSLSVHTQIRVAHDTAQAVLEVIQERQVSVILLGWRGKEFTPGRVFGDVVDTLIRLAACHVMVVRLDKHLKPIEKWERWLVPVAGGPNAQIAIQDFMPSLAKLGEHPQIELCQIFKQDQNASDVKLMNADANFLKDKVHCPVGINTIISNSIADSIIELAHKFQSDAIVLGASREGFLQQAVKGNIPETIARQSPCTVILLRGALSSGNNLSP